MNSWNQYAPNTWRLITTHGSPELIATDVCDLFNEDIARTGSNFAVAVSYLDQYLTVPVDHEVWEIEADVILIRANDLPENDHRLVEGLDT